MPKIEREEFFFAKKLFEGNCRLNLIFQVKRREDLDVFIGRLIHVDIEASEHHSVGQSTDTQHSKQYLV